MPTPQQALSRHGAVTPCSKAENWHLEPAPPPKLGAAVALLGDGLQVCDLAVRRPVGAGSWGLLWVQSACLAGAVTLEQVRTPPRNQNSVFFV